MLMEGVRNHRVTVQEVLYEKPHRIEYDLVGGGVIGGYPLSGIRCVSVSPFNEHWSGHQPSLVHSGVAEDQFDPRMIRVIWMHHNGSGDDLDLCT